MPVGDGTLYLLCFAPGIRRDARGHAKHYLGYVQGGAENVDRRLREHLRGAGSPLVHAAVTRGLEVHLARTWTSSDRDTERRFKNSRNVPRLCPRCQGAAASTTPLFAAESEAA